MTTTYLFALAFQNLHGVSVADTLRGVKVWNICGTKHIIQPDEVDAFEKDYIRVPQLPWVERHAQALTKDRTAEAVKAWQFEGLLNGDTLAAACRLRDLTSLMSNEREIATVRLYRGARISPEQQATLVPEQPLAMSTDKIVAKQFAGKNGKVYTYKESTLIGIDLAKFGGVRRTVGETSRPEKEWLIHTLSFIK